MTDPNHAGWNSLFTQVLEQLDSANLLRRRVQSDTESPTRLRRGDGLFVNFGGNDYLGLRTHPQVIAAAVDAAARYGTGSGASPLVTGYSSQHAQVERQLAELCAAEDALVFTSGYATNQATIASLVGQGDAIFSDQLNHASLIDGCRLSKAERYVYPHLHLDRLEEMLALHRSRFRRAIIVTETVFSMDGDVVPLPTLVELSERFDCGLVIDEAHATGVYGAEGAGVAEEVGCQAQVLAKLGTLSKALGGAGGYLCGDRCMVECILNLGRSYMFSTAPPPAAMASASVAIRLCRQMRLPRLQLRETAHQLRARLGELGYKVLGSDSPILPVVLGSENQAMRLADVLLQAGVYAPPIRPPTVPQGTSRLRITLSASHTAEDIERLVAGLELAREPIRG